MLLVRRAATAPAGGPWELPGGGIQAARASWRPRSADWPRRPASPERGSPPSPPPSTTRRMSYSAPSTTRTDGCCPPTFPTCSPSTSGTSSAGMPPSPCPTPARLPGRYPAATMWADPFLTTAEGKVVLLHSTNPAKGLQFTAVTQTSPTRPRSTPRCARRSRRPACGTRPAETCCH
ncbi:NUDIX hydrolase [Kitasatospora sp. NPDC001683]